jgi:hypothetical protein
MLLSISASSIKNTLLPSLLLFETEAHFSAASATITSTSVYQLGEACTVCIRTFALILSSFIITHFIS